MSGDESIQSCHVACELLDVLGASIAVMALIFSGLASIPRWLTMNLSSFFLRHTKDALCRIKLPSKLPQAIECFLEIGDELIVGSGLDDHLIHVSFNVTV
jgi:hypothetical protein